MAFTDTEFERLQESIRTATTEGIIAVVKDDEALDIIATKFVAILVRETKKEAVNKAGSTLLSFIAAVFSKLGLVALIVLSAYAFGGFGAVGKVWAFLTATEK